MVNPDEGYKKLIDLLDSNHVEYKLFSHKEALTWEELAEVQKETGFFGTEMKCMVLKAGDKFIVYITLQGKRLNFDAIKGRLSPRGTCHLRLKISGFRQRELNRRRKWPG